MRALRLTLLAAVAALALAAALWSGDIAAAAADAQRTAQNALAEALRAVQAGEPGAVAAVLTVCFAYGFAHAVGPGHGKVLIGGYGVGRPVRPWALIAAAVLSSLGQAVTAVALVSGGFLLFGLTRQQMTGLAETELAAASAAAIALIGVWLVVRGGRGLVRAGRDRHGHDHDHGHGHDCGHSHGPSADEIAAAGSPRAIALLILSVAIRPCTGALFLLVIAWYLGAAAVGIAGAFAMALGTAAVTVAVALAAVWSRQAASGLVRAGGRVALLMPALEIVAGAAVAVIALRLMMQIV
ncbi:hypothetical protein DXV76_14185 [Rhodobacteraceae bacterium CCMM004]|nr:hypothetical protein DXV76_14185 [Rhodobacteraceae bacterium CCMM004]